MKRMIAMLTMVAALGLSGTAALADGALTPHHGGRIIETKAGQRLELVVGGGGVEVYLTDHGGSPVGAAGLTGKATILANGRKTDIALSPAGGNRMVGSGAVQPGPASAIVIIEGAGTRLVANFPG